MYSYKLVQAPRRCAAGCGTNVTSRVAGHHYSDPMCETCFSAAAPTLAGILRALQPATSIQLLPVRSSATCANCGDRLSGRIAGYHIGDPWCAACFRKQAVELTALLLLAEAALEAAGSSAHAADLRKVALFYAKTVDHLDEEKPRAPLRKKLRRGGGG